MKRDELQLHPSYTTAVRPSTPQFNSITLLEFAGSTPCPGLQTHSQIERRTKKVVVIPRPYCSPNPDGPNYEQYCCQLLMQHKTLWEVNQLKAGHVTFAEAYATFFQSGDIPRSLEADIFRLQ